MDELQILYQWDKIYGQLRRERRIDFLKHPATKALTHFSDARVMQALTLYRQPWEALEHLKASPVESAIKANGAPEGTGRTRTTTKTPETQASMRSPATTTARGNAKVRSTATQPRRRRAKSATDPRNDIRYVKSHTAIRSKDGLVPSAPADAELHKMIGRTQSYDDTF